MNEHELPYGERSDGRLMSAFEVARGEACDCVCPNCRRVLVAHQGPERPWHFQHKGMAGGMGGCAGYYETMLHKLAKQVLLDAPRLYVPPLMARYGHRREEARSGRWVEITGVGKEIHLREVVPDVIVMAGERELFVEVFVAHLSTEAKLAWLAEHQQPAIEIDLSGARSMTVGLEAYILGEAPRKWLWHSQQEAADAALGQRIEAYVARQRERQEAERLAREAEAERQRALAEQRDKDREAERTRVSAERQAELARWNEEHAEELAAAATERAAKAEAERAAKKVAYDEMVARERKRIRDGMEGRIPLEQAIAEATRDAQRRYERNKRMGLIR